METRDRQPPRLGRWIVRLWPLGPRRPEVEADLLELFAARAARRGRRFASRRYMLDALSLWRCRRPTELSAARHSLGGAHAMKQDVVFAARLFRRQPGLFGMTVVGLAAAVGVSTAVFSTVKTVAFGDYGIAGPETVFRVALKSGTFTRVTGGTSAMGGNWAFADYTRLQASATTFTLVASTTGSKEFRATSSSGSPLPVTVMAVSGNYFSVLGMRAPLGRTLTVADDNPGIRHVLVSYGFWKSHLGADSAIVGREIWLGDRAFTIVGIADRAHSGPGSRGYPPVFWITLASFAEMSTGESEATSRETHARLQALKRRTGIAPAERQRLAALEADLSVPPPQWNPPVDVLGRLKPGTTRAQAETEVRTVANALAREYFASHKPLVELESPDSSSGDSVLVAGILMTAVGLVVFLACANVTNLLLASAASRRREIGTRLAMGASRARIVQQLLTESMLLGLLGGALGLAVAIAILPSFAALVQVPPSIDVSPDFAVYAFVGLLTIAVGVIAGLAPAFHGRRGDLVSALHADQRSAPRPLPKGWLRGLLVGGQAAVSVVLLVLAALLVRALVETTGFDVGYDVNRLVSISAGPRSAGRAWSPARRAAYGAEALDQIRQLPGVSHASLAVFPPFAGRYSAQMLNGRPVDRNETSPEYFDTVGLRLLKGRIYTAAEMKAGAPVAVISASLARELGGTDGAVGASLERVWGPHTAADAGILGPFRKPKGARVIGVVADATIQLTRQNASTIYLPLSETSVTRFVVRAREDPHSVAGPIRNVLESLDPSVRPTLAFAADGLQRELERPRLLASLSVLVGATALGLALIGLFGVTAFVVEHRTHEVTVRRALGASSAQLMAMLFRESLRPVIVGLGCGLIVSLAGGRVLQSALYGISSRDPLAIAAAIVILLSAAACAIFFPARRVAHVDPAQLLKMG